jgi:hypothetical protein
MRTLQIQWLTGDEDLLRLFIDWLFLGASNRRSSSKNPSTPMRGFWLDYDQPDPRRRGKGGIRKGPAYIHQGDLVVRRYAAIFVLRESGRTLKAACSEVAERVYGRAATLQKCKSISTSFLQCRNPFRNFWVDAFVNGFGEWLDLEIKANLFENGWRFSDLKSVVELRAKRVYDDTKERMKFVSRWEELAARAVLLLAPKIEKGGFSCSDAGTEKDRFSNAKTDGGLQLSITGTATGNGTASPFTAPRARKSQTS